MELQPWLEKMKAWASVVARRRRRPDLVDDIESAAVEIMLTLGRMGQDPDPSIETQIARELDLGDNFSTSRDSDLTAAVNEQSDRESIGSFVGELISDGTTEDTIIALLDREPIEEGRDLEEIEEDLDQVMPLLRPREEKLFVLRNMLSLTWPEIAKHMRISVPYAWLLYDRAQRRTSAMLSLKKLLKQSKEPEFTELEIDWLTL